jgi:hypothetical protein
MLCSLVLDVANCPHNAGPEETHRCAPRCGYRFAMERPVFPLIVHDEERPVLRLALKIFRDDLGHEEHRVAAVVDEVAGRITDDEREPVELDAAGLKVTWSALHTLLDNTVRQQHDDREHLRALLDRLPGEHDVRAIDLDAELDRRP